MYEFECIGKNVEKAIEEGLTKLKQKKDNVDIKILDTGGFFKKARVKLIISDELYNSSEDIRKALALSNLEKKIENPEDEEKFTKETVKETNQSKVKQENIVIVQENEKNVSTDLETEVETEQRIKSKQFEECEAFLQGLINIAKIEGFVKGNETESEIFLEIKGKYLSKLVGIKGQGLNAIQVILSVISSKYSRNSKKVRFDIDGYKNKRKLSLENMAKNMALKVLETKEKVNLQPMPAYERRIVHSIIQEYPKLTSISTGEEPYRVLTIDLKK